MKIEFDVKVVRLEIMNNGTTDVTTKTPSGSKEYCYAAWQTKVPLEIGTTMHITIEEAQ